MAVYDSGPLVVLGSFKDASAQRCGGYLLSFSKKFAKI
jgi:hypothetical protein